MKISINKLAIPLFLTATLVACETTGTTSGQSALGSDNTTGAKNLAELDTNQITMKSEGYLSVINDAAGKITYTNSDASFEVKKNPAGGYDIIFDGETRTSKPNITSSYILKVGETANLLLTDHIQSQALTSFVTTHSNVIFAAKKTSETDTEVLIGAFGVKPSMLPEKTASYSGKAAPDYSITSDIKLDLNFESSELTGKLYNFKQTTRGTGSLSVSAVAGELTLANGKINGSAISADLSGTIIETATTGSLKGNLFGKNGEEVAGSIITKIAGKDSAYGAFIAKQ